MLPGTRVPVEPADRSRMRRRARIDGNVDMPVRYGSDRFVRLLVEYIQADGNEKAHAGNLEARQRPRSVARRLSTRLCDRIIELGRISDELPFGERHRVRRALDLRRQCEARSENEIRTLAGGVRLHGIDSVMEKLDTPKLLACELAYRECPLPPRPCIDIGDDQSLEMEKGAFGDVDHREIRVMHERIDLGPDDAQRRSERDHPRWSRRVPVEFEPVLEEIL